MSTSTARDLIVKSMVKAGILVKDEVPDNDEANDALDTLNDLLDSYSNESLLIYARTWESFPLSNNVGSYTIGPSGTFNTVRPTLIKAATVTLPGSNSDLDMKVISDEAYFNNIIVKSTQGVPEFLNYDNAYPLAKIRIWTVPTGTMTLNILSEKPITTFATLDQLIVFPPGWKRFLITNLAVDLAGEYGQQPNPIMVDNAKKSRGNVQRTILKTRNMDSPLSTTRRRSILADQA